MKEKVGKIEFNRQDTWLARRTIDGTQTPIFTPQISWMFDPNGAALIELIENGYILTTFKQDSKGDYRPLRRFVKTEDRNLIWSMFTHYKKEK